MNPPTAQEARDWIDETIRVCELSDSALDPVLAYIDHAEKRIEELEGELKSKAGALDAMSRITARQRQRLRANDPEKEVLAKVVALKNQHGVDISHIYKSAAQPSPDEWEYYEKPLSEGRVWRRRINHANEVECQCWDDGPYWDREACSSGEIDTMRNQLNGWKRVEGRDL
jgi:hypothetical protein